MPKITRLSEFQHEIPFFTFNENFDAFYAQFLKTDLGKIYLSTPFSELAKSFKIKEFKKGSKSMAHIKKLGRSHNFEEKATDGFFNIFFLSTRRITTAF